ncbi:MAG TPA: hypothetical protein VE269_03495 [Gaiellaceae bacterium]|nr:hypothetical protein [Gaiellaceae bacterium]
MSDDRSEPSLAAEQRLDELLALLAAEHPAADPAFAQTVVQRARFQRAIAAPLRTVGSLVAAVGASVGFILGLRPGDRR